MQTGITYEDFCIKITPTGAACDAADALEVKLKSLISPEAWATYLELDSARMAEAAMAFSTAHAMLDS